MNNNVSHIEKNFGSMHALQNDVREALEGSRSILIPIGTRRFSKCLWGVENAVHDR